MPHTASGLGRAAAFPTQGLGKVSEDVSRQGERGCVEARLAPGAKAALQERLVLTRRCRCAAAAAARRAASLL
eukprot:6197973-Pleurochrysis_carterae.AAC.3